MKPSQTLGFLAIYNIVQNTFLSRRGYVTGNLIATGIGLVWARRSGLSSQSIGLSGRNLSKGLGLGAGAAVAAAGLATLVGDHEVVRKMLDDRRLTDLSDRQLWFRLLVRFPLGTALFEEFWFRGIVPAALESHGSSNPDLVAAVAFTAWHLIPTASAVDANESIRLPTLERKALLVAGGSLAAGAGGLVFSAMRRGSGSVAAPWVAHTAINSLWFWVAVRSRRSR